MIRVNPVQFNTNSRKYISFGEGNMNNITPSVAILALQNPNAKIILKTILTVLKKLIWFKIQISLPLSLTKSAELSANLKDQIIICKISTPIFITT